jgi:DNA-binding SARP family transcriptional activator
MPRIQLSTDLANGSPIRPTGPDTPSDVHLQLIHGFSLRRDGQPLTIPTNAQRLVALLALENRPLMRTHLAANLWPDSSEERSAASLRSALWRLNAAERSIVHAAPDHLRLSTVIAVDLHQITERARRVLRASVECHAEDLDERWFSGDLLPEWYDEWVVLERERFRQLRLHALEALAERLVTHRRYGEAVQAALLAVRDEPLRESAHRSLVGAFLAEGNIRDALIQYTRYRQNLHEELGVAPSMKFEEMMRHIRFGGNHKEHFLPA